MMATSSITHNFEIKNPEAAERFANAIEESSSYIGEDKLYEILSDFAYPKNPDVEVFLHENAIKRPETSCGGNGCCR